MSPRRPVFAVIVVALLLMEEWPARVRGGSSGAWLTQDLSAGFGRIRMGDERFVGRFGGGAWGRLNGADLDGDGDIDLVATFGSGGGALGTYSGLFVYENVGTIRTALLGPGARLATDQMVSAETPYVGDANADRRPDIFCNGWLFLNESGNGLIRFASPQSSPDPNWRHPAEGDWNGDGVLDRFAETLWDLRWRDGKTGESRGIPVGGESLLTDVFIRPFVCDWDGDHDLDILIGQESGHVTFVENVDKRLMAEAYVSQTDPGMKSGCASVPAVCDWDGDGDRDLIVGNAAGFLEFFEHDRGQFKQARRLQSGGEEVRVLAGEFGSVQGPEEARWGYTCPEAADWDLDGDLDLIVGCVTGETLFFENAGSRTEPRLASAVKLRVDWGDSQPVYPAGIRFTPEPGVLVTQWRCRPQTADWNRDGLPDLITIDEAGYLAAYPRFRNERGLLALRPATHPFLDEALRPLRFCSHSQPGRNGRVKFAFADWDGDGDLDIIRSGGDRDGSRNLDNHANFTYLECVRTLDNRRAVFAWRGELVPSDRIRLQGHTDSPVVMDIDGNGTLDVVSGCEDGHVYWFRREWIDRLSP